MGMMDKDFDFIVTATRTENNRKLKVPGDVPAVGKMSFEIARLREEIKTKNVPQLKEILERQDRILNNSVLLKKLPDKGEKAKNTKVMIEDLIRDKNKVDALEKEMEKMKINTDKMEWKGHLLDSDDDSDPEEDGPVKNPLSVLAQGIVPKVSSRAKKEAPSSTGMSDLELFAIKEAEKIDNLETKDNFVPFKAIKSNEIDEVTKKTLLNMNDVLKNSKKPELSKFEKRKQEKRQQKTKTPSYPLPNSYNCETKQLSLTESLKLQQEQDKKFREVQMRHAAEKLSAAALIGDSVKTEDVHIGGGQFQEYRDQREEDQDQEDSGDEGVGVVGITQVSEHQDD